MRRFFFDLLVDNVVTIDPGGMVFVWRDDLRDRDAWIRVRDAGGREVYRAAVWSENVEKVGWDQA